MSTVAAGVGAGRPGMTARGFGRLLKKELRGQESLFPLLALVTLLWELFLITRLGAWDRAVVAGLSFLPMGLVPFWVLWAGFQSVRAEWAGDHAQWLLALPVPYWQVQGTKLVAIAIQAAAVTTFAGIVGLILMEPVLSAPGAFRWEEVRANWVTAAGLLYALGCLHLAVFGQFVSAAWRSVGRFGLLVAAWSAMVVVWAWGRASGILGYLFQWVPDLSLIMVNVRMGGAGTQVIREPIIFDTAPLLGSVLFAALLFAAGALLLERAADV